MSDQAAAPKLSPPFEITTLPVDAGGLGVLTVTNDGFDLRVVVEAAKWKPVEVAAALRSIAAALDEKYRVAPEATMPPSPGGLLQ